MKVIRRFKDKETRKIYEVGERYDGTKTRFEALQEKGFLEKSKKKATKKSDKK